MSNKKQYTKVNRYLYALVLLTSGIFLSLIMILAFMELHIILGVIVCICCIAVILVVLPIVVCFGKIEVTNEGLIMQKKLYFWSDIVSISMESARGCIFAKFILKGEKKNIKITLSSLAFDKIKERTNSEELLKMMADADIRF